MTVSSSDSPFRNFQSLDVTGFRRTLAKLHEAVGCDHGRVEVTRRGCNDVCVLISKCELDALEQALEILAQSAEYKAMCDDLTRVVARCAGCAEETSKSPTQDGATGA
jgi:PHD/YefM family antitoxin component YafN of YafNO toxin-antitoxin module